MIQNLRNIAIIAHVDHGKTTLVDQLLQQSGTLDSRSAPTERVMDSNTLEKERGITILAKNTAITWNGYRINIVDTPGHADFGGEVERVLSMVDCVLLLVDAVEGPMPQTRFVTQKAFDLGLKPIVVINKIDRPGARPDWVLDQTFDLFDRLGATDEQLDFPVVYCSGLNGYASFDADAREGDMTPIFQTIIDKVEAPDVDVDGPFQMQVSSLDFNNYVGVIGVGRITRGKLKTNTQVTIIDNEGKTRNGRVLQVSGYMGLERIEVPEAEAGDIICFTGIDVLNISDTLCDPDNVEALPPLSVDEPTISMTFQVNNSPFAGKDGKFVTSRQIRERLTKELVHNVALRVEDTEDPDRFRVSGRGELHLSILIENMRRERLDYIIPSRGLIGFRTEFLTATQGSGLIYNVFDHYGPLKQNDFGQRINGVLIANAAGKALAYALFNLQERGRLFIGHAEEVYEGMVIGIHSRDNDLVVNPLKAKQLNNIRAAGTDENLILTPPIRMTLEQALEFIDDDELVEVTPNFTRVRKKLLKETDRKRASRSGN